MKGGYVHGKSDEIGQHVAEKPVTMQDCNATIAQAMGMDLTHIKGKAKGQVSCLKAGQLSLRQSLAALIVLSRHWHDSWCFYRRFLNPEIGCGTSESAVYLST